MLISVLSSLELVPLDLDQLWLAIYKFVYFIKSIKFYNPHMYININQLKWSTIFFILR